MSNKKPMKFLPPDDPTAVYPIRAVQVEEEPELPEPPPEPTPELPSLDEDFGTRDGEPSLVTTAPDNGNAGPSVLVLLAFLGGGMLLAAGVLAALALLLYLFQ